MTRGVGIIGAGAGASALHLPFLARMPDLFRVTHIADGGSGRARSLATRHGARSSSGVDELLGDPDVDVVLVAGPPHLHAAHVSAAAAAGVRGILCEKPLGLTPLEIDHAIDACRRAGTPLVVGTHHRHDPGFERVAHELLPDPAAATSVSVVVAIPPNGRYYDLVTESALPAAPPPPAPARGDADADADAVRQLILGIGIHDLPAVRHFAPQIDGVLYAYQIAPRGYSVGAYAGDLPVHLSLVLYPDGPDVLWRLSVTTLDELVEVDYAPSFVHAGGARVRVHRDDGTSIEYPRPLDDGYTAEWRKLARLVDGADETDYDAVLEDALYALRWADGAYDAVVRGAR